MRQAPRNSARAMRSALPTARPPHAFEHGLWPVWPATTKWSISRASTACAAAAMVACATRHRVMEKLKADASRCVHDRQRGGELHSRGQMAPIRVGGGKGTVRDGEMRLPMIARWPGQITAGQVENGLMAGPDFLPTLTAIATDAHIKGRIRIADRQATRRR